MSISLLKNIQDNLGYPPLQKIDPNTQEVTVDPDAPPEERFSQAAIPAVLTALFTYSRSDQGADLLLHEEYSADWLTIIFDDQKKEIIGRIAVYSGQSIGDTEASLDSISKEAINVIRYQVNEGSFTDVKALLADSHNEVLLYLPASLELGTLLHNNTLDDSTHKMEGPVSSLMHAIGGSFSGTDSDETNPAQ